MTSSNVRLSARSCPTCGKMLASDVDHCVDCAYASPPSETLDAFESGSFDGFGARKKERHAISRMIRYAALGVYLLVIGLSLIVVVVGFAYMLLEMKNPQ